MKNIFKIFLLTVVTVGMCNIAGAQRGPDNIRSGSSANGRSIYSRPDDRGSRGSAPVRSFRETPSAINRGTSSRGSASYQERNRNTSPSARNEFPRTTTQSSERNFSNSRTLSQRNRAGDNSYSRQYQRQSRNSRNYGNSRKYSTNRYHPYNNSRYNNNYYRAGYGRRPVFMYGPRYTVIPRNSISIHFGGNPYYYNRGYFYGYYGGYYQPIFPPFGLRISVLPLGYTRLFIGTDPFFYYNGVYYRQYNDNDYEVVDAPMGATVSSLPRGAKSVSVNGEKLYELNGTFYKADRDSRGKKVYIVVGKNGEINNTDEGPDKNDVTDIPSTSSLQMGDIIDQLPEGSKTASINGEKLYVTPDDIYLKEESVNGTLQYEVVGK